MTLAAIIEKIQDGLMQAADLVRYSQTENINVRGHEYTLKMRRNPFRNLAKKPLYDYFSESICLIEKAGYTYRFLVREPTLDYMCVYSGNYKNLRLFDWDGNEAKKFGFPRSSSRFDFWWINDFCGMKYVQKGSKILYNLEVSYQTFGEREEEYFPFNMMLFSLYGFERNTKKTRLIRYFKDMENRIAKYHPKKGRLKAIILEKDMRYTLESIYLGSDGSDDPRFKAIAEAYVSYLENHLLYCAEMKVLKSFTSDGFKKMGLFDSERLSSLYVELNDNLDEITNVGKYYYLLEDLSKKQKMDFHEFMDYWFDENINKDADGNVDDPDLEKKMETFLGAICSLTAGPVSKECLFRYINYMFQMTGDGYRDQMMDGFNEIIDVAADYQDDFEKRLCLKNYFLAIDFGVNDTLSILENEFNYKPGPEDPVTISLFETVNNIYMMHFGNPDSVFRLINSMQDGIRRKIAYSEEMYAATMSGVYA